MEGNYIIVLLVLFGFGESCLGDRVRLQECLDPGCLYVMGYEPNVEKEEITFDVTVKTTGYVGFGLAPKAGMDNADIVIGGIRDGITYFQDYHGTGKMMPTLDKSQDWEILEASENATHTHLKFKRFFQTCDKENDITITADTINVIWSFGETDSIGQHSQTNRGARQFLLLDPPPAFNENNMKEFEIHPIRVRNTVPEQKTSYVCSFHKFPKFENQKYLVGVEAFLENQDAIRHTHHFSVTTCRMDDTSILEQLLVDTANEGKDCLEELLWIRPYCNEVLFGWAVGGKRVMLPEHVGVPFGEASSGGNGDGSLYIMLEVHYENPTERFGVKYTTGFNTYYTDKKREFDGSIIMVGHDVNPALLIPPQSKNYVVAGHCSSEVTKKFVPKEGINIIGVNMHSHIAGREMRVRHFRNNKELPWVLNDKNYDFDYQQTRELRNEVKLLPGDHLTNECIFNTMDRNFTTLGGESTYEEMCHTYLVYYPRIELRGCKSTYPLKQLFPKFNIAAVNGTHGNLFNPTVVAPEALKGKLFSQVLNELEWTNELRNQIQHEFRYGNHTAFYAAGDYNGETNETLLARNFGVPQSYGAKDATIISGFTTYPQAEDYELPEGQCKSRTTTAGTNSSLFISNFKIIIITLCLAMALR